ncbi:MAG: radical SAM protein [Patescibacteria group bacterium]|nr:radical SAM protein [Patescibacteria group bacterium]
MKDKIKKIIRNIPILSGIIKKNYDRWQEEKLQMRIREFLAEKELPFVDTLPPFFGIGHEPTIRCNLKCKMCYQGQTRNLRQDELSPAEVQKIYEKLKRRVKTIKIVGGEPMLRPDIYDMIRFWDKLGKRVILQTNCTLITEDSAKKLAKFKNLSDIATSLDGPEEIHDEIRGVPGTYRRLIDAISCIKKLRPDIRITVFGMILFDEGLDYLPKLIKVSRGLDLPSINLLFEQVYCQQNVENTQKIFAKEFGWENVPINTQVRDPLFKAREDPKKRKQELDEIFKLSVKKKCYANFTPFNFY